MSAGLELDVGVAVGEAIGVGVAAGVGVPFPTVGVAAGVGVLFAVVGVAFAVAVAVAVALGVPVPVAVGVPVGPTVGVDVTTGPTDPPFALVGGNFASTLSISLIAGALLNFVIVTTVIVLPLRVRSLNWTDNCCP